MFEAIMFNSTSYAYYLHTYKTTEDDSPNVVSLIGHIPISTSLDAMWYHL